MDAKTCLKKMELVGVLNVATVDENGNPQIRCISAVHYDEDSFYFFTARGKNVARELLSDGRVQILVYTRFKEMIRLSARAYPVAEEKQKAAIDTIFEEQPYLANLYPGDKRYVGICFEIKDGSIEYFNLGVNPIFRETYTIGNGIDLANGKATIRQQNCLHCGACFEKCPVNAIERS